MVLCKILISLLFSQSHIPMQLNLKWPNKFQIAFLSHSDNENNTSTEAARQTFWHCLCYSPQKMFLFSQMLKLDSRFSVNMRSSNLRVVTVWVRHECEARHYTDITQRINEQEVIVGILRSTHLMNSAHESTHGHTRTVKVTAGMPLLCHNKKLYKIICLILSSPYL